MSDESRTASETETERGEERAAFPATRYGWLSRFEGPHTIGESQPFWGGVAAVALFALVYPVLTNEYQVILVTVILLWVVLALTLAFVWGYAGIFSFGQTAFFGLGGYVFGVVGQNVVDTTGAMNVALLAAFVVPTIFATVIGYFIFYGRISGVYVGIITFSVTIILGLLLTRTSGMRIGEATLGGLTGMSGIPTLTLGYGPATVSFGNVLVYYLAVVLLGTTYFGLRYLLNSDLGYVMVATREDEERTEMFGYDVRKVKLQVFALGAGLAGVAGALYASAGHFINPEIMSLTAAALPVIWVTVGGRTTLLGTIVGAFGLQYLDQKISLLGSQFSLILLALIVIAAILFFPEGLVPYVNRRLGERRERDTDERAVTGSLSGGDDHE